MRNKFFIFRHTSDKAIAVPTLLFSYNLVFSPCFTVFSVKAAIFHRRFLSAFGRNLPTVKFPSGGQRGKIDAFIHARKITCIKKRVYVQNLFFAIAVKTAVIAGWDTALRGPRHLLNSALTIFRN